MKYLIALCCIVVTVIAEEKYSDKYDDFDIDELLGNERLLNAYGDCMLDKGPCTAEGKALKENMQDALETGCSKCTDKQEKEATKVINHLVLHLPALWDELTAKYDPTGKYRKEYEGRAKEAGIILP